VGDVCKDNVQQSCCTMLSFGRTTRLRRNMLSPSSGLKFGPIFYRILQTSALKMGAACSSVTWIYYRKTAGSRNTKLADCLKFIRTCLLLHVEMIYPGDKMRYWLCCRPSGVLCQAARVSASRQAR
jgi:hypothetical protein